MKIQPNNIGLHFSTLLLKSLLSSIILLISLPIYCQSDLIGHWGGEILMDRYHVPIGLDISADGDKLKVLIDNPAQGAARTPVQILESETDIKFKYGSGIMNLSFASDKAELRGSWIQSEKEDRVILKRGSITENPYRPQTPTPPYLYTIDSIVFNNEVDKIELAGTLLTPESDSREMAVILLTGSGAQNRDEEILHHRPFAVIADFLSSRGVTVLRYDDRGTAESSGKHMNATSFDFAKDAAAAYNYLRKELSKNHQIGFLGHSEGGIIAQIADSIVQGVDFHIYLAGPGENITELMVEQNRQFYKDIFEDPQSIKTHVEAVAKAFGIVVDTTRALKTKQKDLNELLFTHYNSLPEADAKKLGPSASVFAMGFSQTLYLKWWRYFLAYQPGQYLKQISAPILALNGSRDIQVSTSNLNAITSRATNSVSVTTKEYPGLNHLFQNCYSCKVSEYGLLTETISIDVLKNIDKWLKEHF